MPGDRLIVNVYQNDYSRVKHFKAMGRKFLSRDMGTKLYPNQHQIHVNGGKIFFMVRQNFAQLINGMRVHEINYYYRPNLNEVQLRARQVLWKHKNQSTNA